MTVISTEKSSRSTHKSSPNKSAAAKVQVSKKSSGISVKRKSTPGNIVSIPVIAKKKKKTKTPPLNNNNNNNNKTSKLIISPLNNISDLELTICPICDEACTCPKTIPTVKSPIKKKHKMKEKMNDRNPIVSSSRKQRNNISISKDNKKNKDKVIENESGDDIVEDPALSFIRMIYSDEESLDEEEAYALYQATQLFSSSSDEEEDQVSEQFKINRKFEGIDYESEDSESENSEIESDFYTSDTEEEFEYTVVEYVHPIFKNKKSTEFIAYESDSELEETSYENEIIKRSNSNLLLNATVVKENLSSCSDDDDEDEDEDEGDLVGFEEEEEDNWTTFSVFDVDRDMINFPYINNTQMTTSLSSHGSGTPDTLLFSTSSTDKIPNIAPQVLAAISAAAKHMANRFDYSSSSFSNNNNNNHHNNHNSRLNNSQGQNQNSHNNSSTKYFSYITLKDSEEFNEEEFLFFEELPVDDDEEEAESFEEEFDSDVEIEEKEDFDIQFFDKSERTSDLKTKLIKDTLKDQAINKKNTRAQSLQSQTQSQPQSQTQTQTQSQSHYSGSSNQAAYFNRWKRVPIGAFRRSRRPSIPNYHHIHPAHALKTFSTDPASLTLTIPLSLHGAEDSFDESTPTERSHSVITWDELDLDITIGGSNTINNNNNSNSPVPQNNYNSWPLPKRSRSAIPSSSSNSIANNFEWLNNWNWE